MSPSNVHAATTVFSSMRIRASLACQWSLTPSSVKGGSAGSNRWNPTSFSGVARVIDVFPWRPPFSSELSSLLSEFWCRPSSLDCCGDDPPPAVVSGFPASPGEHAANAAPTPGIASESVDAVAMNLRRVEGPRTAASLSISSDSFGGSVSCIQARSGLFARNPRKPRAHPAWFSLPALEQKRQ